MLAHLDLLLPSLFDALHAPSERVVVEALSVQAAIAADDPQQFRTLMQELIDRCLAACQSHSAEKMGSDRFLLSFACLGTVHRIVNRTFVMNAPKVVLQTWLSLVLSDRK